MKPSPLSSRHAAIAGRPLLGRLFWACVFWVCVFATAAWSQEPAAKPAPPVEEEAAPAAPRQVDVRPVAEDAEIEARLLRILRATEWFQAPRVEVDEGVVFLRGRTQTEDHQQWATQLAQNTQDVVAVVNRIEVTGRPLWDFSPAWAETRALWRDTVQAAPMVGVALALLAVTFLTTWGAKRASGAVFERRMENAILRQMAANAVAAVVLVLGVYLVLKISGLTRLAVTVLGGTGLFGLVVGIAFRDIAENFLASLLLSVRRPFEIDDLIDIDGRMGIVQAVTTRGTMLMTFDGNHIHIPNSSVYKSVINNYTANPNMRLDFTVGIGYDDKITTAQEVGVAVLREHPAVLEHPEPMALVDQLGSSTVNLKFYFWVNIREHSTIKVRSAAMRLVKQAFQKARISMPDDAREVLFPKGIPVRMLPPDAEPPAESPIDGARRGARSDAPASPPEDRNSTQAEGGLESEAETIQAQARQARQPPAGENLLAPDG